MHTDLLPTECDYRQLLHQEQLTHAQIRKVYVPLPYMVCYWLEPDCSGPMFQCKWNPDKGVGTTLDHVWFSCNPV